ncbi:monofunctional biosynthetic peptidoglycan transglycosylase, partial [Alistipes sp. OttesenSCG-928-L06]|nr:monofunctional biosynthetic peptidoglycan transglycosylase [Alistipes sp. OttesenSCG-928-L06]
MKYFFRLLVYLAVLFVSFTVVSVLLLRFVPVSFTPLKWVALRENKQDGQTYPLLSKWVPIGEISSELVTAVVTTEDNNFMKHNGFDFDAIKKAIEENREGKRLRGGSTISQQTAKNVFCFPKRTWLRKGVETWFTCWIEWLWGKERIMEVYLNVIETHPNVYGAQETAQRFYQKPASKLSRNEAAMIATVLPSPRRMNLSAPSSYMTKRAGQVRKLMGNVGE